MATSPPRAVLILAGGAGTRLWPLSTEAVPKQFLQIFGGESLLQMAWSRLADHTNASSMFVSTNESYRDQIVAQLPDLPPENVLVEPARRNTAPAIAACCATIRERLGNVTVGIFPSDHWVGDRDAFRDTVDRAFDFAAENDYLVTIGLQPTEPNTGYGYLELADPIDAPVYRLSRFVEKPDVDKARQFVDAGNYLWNGGMFVWRLDRFFARMEAAAPDVARLALAFAAEIDSTKARAAFESMPSISIDYALMEKAPNVATVRADMGWSDVGSWAAVARYMSPNDSGTLQSETSNVFVHSETDRPIAVVGAENLFVIDSPNGLLVLDTSSSEKVSSVAKEIAKKSG